MGYKRKTRIPGLPVGPGLPAGPVGVGGYPVPVLPHLPTLFEPASWLNWRGHIDRSACLEISAKEAMAIMRAEAQAARNGQGRVSTCCGVVRGADLERLRGQRRPRTLRGDYRSRAWPMRPRAKPCSPDSGGSGSGGSFGVQTAEGPDHLLPPNPNRGGRGGKVLGLDPDWRQGLRVESWEVARIFRGVGRGWMTAIRRYLICPRPRSGAQSGRTIPVEEPPPLSRRKRGANAKGKCYRGACGERVDKLYMPLCWPEELADARAAQAWLGEVGRLREIGRLEPITSALEGLLVERYGQLFAPRRLGCNRCLGLAYGQVMTSQVPVARRKWFMGRGAPELPDPFARDRLGHQFAHDQLRHTLPKSALKNEKTRVAALKEMGLDRWGEPLKEVDEDAELLRDEALVEQVVREEQELLKELKKKKTIGQRLQRRVRRAERRYARLQRQWEGADGEAVDFEKATRAAAERGDKMAVGKAILARLGASKLRVQRMRELQGKVVFLSDWERMLGKVGTEDAAR